MISTPVHLDRCRRCGKPILSGYSEGAWVRADPTPIDPLGELHALQAGLMTYDLQPLGLPKRPFLWQRTAWRIRGERKYSVHAQHACPPGPHFPPPPAQPVELYIPSGYSVPDNPPF